MKKFLIISVFLLATNFCFAQNEHMKFKGIPIEGTLNSFVQKLQAKGYSYLGTSEGVAILQGEFATQKNCKVVAAKFEDRDQVSTVAVIFPEKETWGSIMDDYTTFKSLLTEKYGQPECVEEFSERVPSSDYLKFHALLEDGCNYISEFKCDNGRIQLSMKKMDYNSASVFIKYIDTANTEELRKKVMEDL